MQYSKLICLNCGNISKVGTFKTQEIICPSCGFFIESSDYFEIIELSEEMVRMGYLYRKRYETDYQIDETLSSRYCLAALPDELIFIGVAAVTGIIGGLSYDIFKEIISKIREQYKPNKNKPYTETVEQIFSNASTQSDFISYLRDYNAGLENVEPKIKNAIFDELKVDSIQEVMTTMMSNGKKIKNPKDIEKSILRKQKAKKSQKEKIIKKIKAEKNLWKKFKKNRK